MTLEKAQAVWPPPCPSPAPHGLLHGRALPGMVVDGLGSVFVLHVVPVIVVREGVDDD